MSEHNELLSKLSEPFPIDEVKQRRQGGVMLDFISIDSTIRRLNDVLGTEWSTSDLSTSLIPLEGGKYLATVALTVVALGKQAVGTGADIAPDPDKAVKTALAEALKKACHQFGIGLYLWQEEERAIVAKQRKAVKTDDYENRAPVRSNGIASIRDEDTVSTVLGDGGF